MLLRALRALKELDLYVLVIVAGLGVFSYLGIAGATPGSDYVVRQAMFYALGFAVMAVILLIDYSYIRTLSPVLYLVGVGLLVGVLVIGDNTRGAVSWYSLPGGFKLQPSEMMKLFLILALAWFFSEWERRGLEIDRVYKLLWPIGILAVPLALILLQPDLGSSLVFISIFAFILVAAKVRVRYLLLLVFLALLFLAILVALYFWFPDLFFKVVDQYQLNRLLTFLNPDLDPWGIGFQLNQSLIAVGSGQLMGKGLFQGTQGQYQWVPDAHTDFVFSVIGEEHGFIGATTLIILFFALFYRLTRIAIEARDTYGVYVIAGVMGMWVFHILENIGMTIGLMPITGIPLPFISYGGSSLLTNFMALGVVLNIGMRRKKLNFGA